MTVLAATSWKSNAELIADVAQLGYLHGATLDPTYGRGTWWKVFRPEHLTTHDLRLDCVDFRQLPEADGTFNSIAFDPPYMAPGGRKSSTIPDFNDRFGLHTTPARPEQLQEVINDGLKELVRVLAPKGFLLVKCQDYINGGAYWNGTFKTQRAAFDLGLRQVDRFEHVRRPGPQPPRPRQVHARRNLSTLLVFQAPK